MPPRIIKVIGVPGSGKTRYILHQIERAAGKYEPSRIGAISFTNAAVNEMKDRVSKVVGPSKASSKNIRTVHSHCFKLLQLDKSVIVDDESSHIQEWNSAFPSWSLPVSLSSSELEDDPISGNSYSTAENIKTHQFMNILRNRCLPIDEWHKEITGIGERAVAFWRDWSHWLDENDLWDFTKILEECKKLRLKPDIDCLFIDESQDLSRLMLDLTEIWGENCDTVVYCGDADQSIFKWAGATPEVFRDLKHDWKQELLQSYRCPQAICEYALKLIRRIGNNREDVSILPTTTSGKVIEKVFPDLSLEGTHMILVRCNYMLIRWKKWLIEKGIVWHNPYRPKTKDWNPADTKTWKAVQTYDRIHRGLEVTGEELREMIAKISAGYMVRGVKTHRKKTIDTTLGPHGLADVFYLSSSGWFEPSFFNFSDPISKIFSLSGNSGKLIEFHGEAITRQDPKCIIGTIHSVKGGQSSNVWVDRSTSMSIGRACMDSSAALDDERRVSYVAVTRSSNVLGLLYPQGPGSMAFV